MRTPAFFLLIAVALVAAACTRADPAIDDFESCIHAGYPVMESYPRRCAVPGGPTFTETLPPSIDDVRSFTGTLVDVADLSEEGDTFFRFEGSDGMERAVLEPEAEFVVDLRTVASGSGLLLHGWRDLDGLVHVVEVRIVE